MITMSSPTLAAAPTVTLDRLQASLTALTDLAAGTGRDTAVGLLQATLREMRAGPRAGA